MSTTALRIELLIIGFQASIWLTLFFIDLESSITFFQAHVKIIKEASAVIVLITLAWCYSLGAAIDGITAIFEDYKFLLNNIGTKVETRETTSCDSSAMRLNFPAAYKELITSDFELRLLRSTAFNLIVIGISILATIKCLWLTLVIFLGGFLVGAAWFRRKEKTKKRRDSLYKKAERISK